MPLVARVRVLPGAMEPLVQVIEEWITPLVPPKAPPAKTNWSVLRLPST